MLKKTYQKIEDLYIENSLLNNLKIYLNKNHILKSIKFMKNDKKNEDEKISFILLKNIGKTTAPGKFKYRIDQVKVLIQKLF